MNGPLRIATRKSALAMWQANHVRALLEQAHPGIHIELLPIVTRGDRILDRPLADIGGKGLFLKELERAMLDGEADLGLCIASGAPLFIPAPQGAGHSRERASTDRALSA